MLNLFQHLDPKNRCTLKSKNPLVADENRVVRQRSPVLRREDQDQIPKQVRDDSLNSTEVVMVQPLVFTKPQTRDPFCWTFLLTTRNLELATDLLLFQPLTTDP